VAVIKGEDVITAYSEVIPDAADQAGKYLGWVQGATNEMELPVRMGMQSAATGLLKSVMGKTREFLVIAPEDKKLDALRMLHWCTPVGKNLAVGWYVVGGKRSVLGLDLFQDADLTALYESIHKLAVMRSIYACVETTGGDRKRIREQVGRGFLGLGGSG
jgi:hypothetical protein